MYLFIDQRVCVACDTDGLTVSGLLTARYLSLATHCTHQEAVNALKISHESFMPMPYAVNEFLEMPDEVSFINIQNKLNFTLTANLATGLTTN